MKSTRRFRRWGAVSLTAWGLLVAASPLLAGSTRRTSVTSSYLGKTNPVAAPTALDATNIEIAWLGESSLFKCRLQAKLTKDTVEVCGFVPNEAVGKKALEVAQATFEGKVVSKLQVQSGMRVNVGLPSEPNDLAAAATACLSEKMGDKLIGLQMSCPKAGCIELNGTVASDADRLELSKCLQGLTGCAQVVNQTTTETVAVVQAPKKVAPKKAPETEKPKPALVQTAARTDRADPKAAKNKIDGPQLAANDGPALDVKPAPLAKAPKSEPIVTDGPALPIIQDSIPTIVEVQHQEVVFEPSMPITTTHASMTTKPNVGRAMIIVPAIDDENKVEQKPVMHAPPPIVTHVIHERRPELLPTPVKPPVATEVVVPKFEAATPKQVAPVTQKSVPTPISSMPEWKTIPVSTTPAAMNVDTNQKKVELVAPVTAAPVVVPPIAQAPAPAPVVQTPPQVVLAAPTVPEAPRVIETPKCDVPIEVTKPVTTCVAPVVEAPKLVEMATPALVTAPPVVQPVVSQVIIPVTTAPKIDAPPATVPAEVKQSGFAAARSSKRVETSIPTVEPKATVKVCQPEAKTVEVCAKTSVDDGPGITVKTDCHFPEAKPIVSLASFSKNSPSFEAANKATGEKQMGIVRVPLASGQSPVAQEAARTAVEDICRGTDQNLDVRTTGAQQLTVSMKVKTHAEWSDLHKQLKSLNAIAGYSLVYRIDVGDGIATATASRPSSATNSTSAKCTAPMMGVIRGKSSGSPMEPDAVRGVIETLCKVHSQDVTVKTAGNRQVSIAMKVANPADWDQLYSRIRQMPEIADYAVIFNVRVQ